MASEAFMDLGDLDLDTFAPMQGVALIRKETVEKVGVLHLPHKSANDRRFDSATARVVKLGPPARTEKTNAEIPWSIREGDRIAVRKFCGHDAIIGGDDNYNLCNEGDILAVIDEPE